MMDLKIRLIGIFIYLTIVSCLKVNQNFLFDCLKVTEDPKELDMSEMLIKDVSFRKGVLAICAAPKAQPGTSNIYILNLAKRKFVWHSSQECDSVAVGINGIISLLKNNKVYSFNKGEWAPLNNLISAKDFAYSHDDSTLYYLDSAQLEEGGGVVKKYENSNIVTRDGSANFIDAGVNGDIFVVNSYNDFFVTKFGQGQKDAWEMIKRGFQDLATCENGDVFAVGLQDGFIYQYLSSSKAFITFYNADKFVKISCDLDSSQLYGVKANKELLKVSFDEGIYYENEKVSLIDISTRNGFIVGCGRVNGSSINYVVKFDSNLKATFVGTQPCSKVAISSSNVISAVVEGFLRSFVNNSWKSIRLQNQIKDFAYSHDLKSSALYYLDKVDPDGAQGGGMVRKFDNGVESLRDGRAFFIDAGNTNEIVVVNSYKNLFHTLFTDQPTTPGWPMFPSNIFKDTAICKNNVVAAASTVDTLMLFNFVSNSQLTQKGIVKIVLNAVTCGDSESDIYGIDSSNHLIKVKV